MAAKERGYAYVAITEHSRRIAMAHGLDTGRLSRQIDEIDRLNAGLIWWSVLSTANSIFRATSKPSGSFGPWSDRRARTL